MKRYKKPLGDVHIDLSDKFLLSIYEEASGDYGSLLIKDKDEIIDINDYLGTEVNQDRDWSNLRGNNNLGENDNIIRVKDGSLLLLEKEGLSWYKVGDEIKKVRTWENSIISNNEGNTMTNDINGDVDKDRAILWDKNMAVIYTESEEVGTIEFEDEVDFLEMGERSVITREGTWIRMYNIRTRRKENEIEYDEHLLDIKEIDGNIIIIGNKEIKNITQDKILVECSSVNNENKCLSFDYRQESVFSKYTKNKLKIEAMGGNYEVNIINGEYKKFEENVDRIPTYDREGIIIIKDDSIEERRVQKNIKPEIGFDV